MKREIKFRAWDVKDDKYMEILLLHTNESGEVFAYTLSDGKQDLVRFKREDCILEQYTGLKDKNGKEIYEGDVVSGCNGSINGHGWTWGPYEIKWISEKAEFNVPLWGTDQSHNSTHWFEIIGNIHEERES